MSPVFHAEDKSQWREAVASSLKKNDLDVVQATGYGDAVKTIDSMGTPPDISLAIVDGNLGDGRGEQVIQHLRTKGYSGNIFSLADDPVRGCKRHFPKADFSGREFGIIIKNEVT